MEKFTGVILKAREEKTGKVSYFLHLKESNSYYPLGEAKPLFLKDYAIEPRSKDFTVDLI